MNESPHDRNAPLVSVAITTFNGQEFLEEALASVSTQDYRPMEIVAYDDASTDSSLSLLENWRDSSDVPVEVIAGNQNIGSMAALKRAMAACSGRYIAILEHDDVWLPGKLQAQVVWLEQDPKRVLCGHDVDCFSSMTGERLWTARDRGLLKAGHGAWHSVRNGPIFPTSSIMLRRVAVPTDFNPLGLKGYTDWNLWSDCLADGGNFGFVPGLFSRYRRTPRPWVGSLGPPIDSSLTHLESGLIWLGSFEARHPEYHTACRFRRATLTANHGRVLFEAQEIREARAYLWASLSDYGASAWKPGGLLLFSLFPSSLAALGYRCANGVRVGLRRLRGGVPGDAGVPRSYRSSGKH